MNNCEIPQVTYFIQLVNHSVSYLFAPLFLSSSHMSTYTYTLRTYFHAGNIPISIKYIHYYTQPK